MNLQAPQTWAAIAEALTDLEGNPIEGEVSGVAAAQMVRRCAGCGAEYVPTERQQQRGCGPYCSARCWGRAGGQAGRGLAKDRTTQLRDYYADKRERGCHTR